MLTKIVFDVMSDKDIEARRQKGVCGCVVHVLALSYNELSSTSTAAVLLCIVLQHDAMQCAVKHAPP